MENAPAPASQGNVQVIALTTDQLREIIREVVVTSLAATLNKQTATLFWEAGVELAQARAKDGASDFVFWSIKTIAKKAGTFLLVGGLLYLVGGWDLLFKVLKFMGSKVTGG